MKQEIPVRPDLPEWWSEASFEYANTKDGAFGHVSATGGGWRTYCVIAFNSERLDALYPSAPEAIEAVEEFVRAQLKVGS